MSEKRCENCKWWKDFEHLGKACINSDFVMSIAPEKPRISTTPDFCCKYYYRNPKRPDWEVAYDSLGYEEVKDLSSRGYFKAGWDARGVHDKGSEEKVGYLGMDKCYDCGARMKIVRPGKWQCPECE